MWVLRHRETILYAHQNKPEVIVEAFRLNCVTRIRGRDGKRNLRLQYGYKIEELDQDAYCTIQERNKAVEHQPTYVRTEENGCIGRVVQGLPKTNS